jgi:hypothetical protein
LPWLRQLIRPRVEVEGDGIVVSVRGTSFRVIYRKPSQAPGLIAFDVRATETQVSLRSRPVLH